MQKRSWSAILALAGAGFLTGAATAKADQVILIQLIPSTGSAAHGMVETKLTLSADKPAGITREPVYKHAPKYGVLTVGDAKINQVYVVLDASDNPKAMPTLYVDGNGDGDLTNDPPVTLAFPPVPKPKVKTVSDDKNAPKVEKKDGKKEEKPADAPAKKPGLEGRVPVVVRYNVSGRGGVVPAALKFIIREGEVSYTSDIVRAGTLKLGAREYRVALVDESGTGIFNKFDHEEDEPVRVHLLVDRNEDGVFDPKREAYDVNAPFNLGGNSYEIKTIDTRGQVLTIGVSPRDVKSLASAEDLKVGAEVLEFEAIATDGKPVSFPNDYKGKIVMLDFWATWCGPCIAEMPNVISVYNRYHNQGFEILGVSLDHPNMLAQVNQFTQQNNMPWRQIYDGGFWNAKIARLYGVDSIPRAILVDGSTGKILAMGNEIRGEALDPAVEKAVSMLKP